jgi:ribonucleoside-triphosphate reductase (thioredoxin)
LPSGNAVYPQMPYTQITQEEYENDGVMKLFPIDLTGVYAGMASEAVGESYCVTDACEVKLIMENTKEVNN